jgi:hypothetical protein
MDERVGMEFELESKLVGVLEAHARSATASPFAKAGADLLVFPEVAVGQVIPDLVIIRARMTGNVSAKFVRLTSFESWIVGELMCMGALSEQTLTHMLFTRTESTISALEKLQKIGVVRRTKSGTYVVTTDFSKRFEIVSVEAKLNRWAAAIKQAKKYLKFSDESFIALPTSVISRNPQIIARCAAEGIGLIAVSRRDVTILRTPVVLAQPDLRQWMWLLSKTGALHI